MGLKEVIEKCKTLDIYEERAVAGDYYEIVFFTKDTEKWQGLCESILGKAVKPAGTEPSSEDIKLTQKYGGIRSNQTLFKKQTDSMIIVAMFWPWQDEVRTTVKVAVIKK